MFHPSWCRLSGMRIIRQQDFKKTPWKNGGGITHEILRDGEGDDFHWRLSVAAVNSSGAFSLFPLHHRILTVISGEGMRLRHGHAVIEALPFVPVSFSGGIVIDGQLINGPCRDFNVIYDASRFSAEVTCVERIGETEAATLVGFMVIRGSIGTAATGDFVLVPATQSSVDTSPGFMALRVCIKALP